MIGLAVLATLRCPYSEISHRGAAQMNGATEEELTEAAAITGQTRFGVTYSTHSIMTSIHS
jgi:AhpD family alkylhydroperoxidase